MSLRGSLRTMPAADLLEWVDRRLASGKLTINRGTTERSFSIDAGWVIHSTSSDPSEYLGQFLINAGHLTEAELERAFRTQSETSVLLGRIVTMIGLVQEKDLRTSLETKIREGLFDALSWGDGTFLFEPEVFPPRRPNVEIAVSLKQALLDGNERLLKWQEIRRLLPRDDVAFQLAAGAPADAIPAGTLKARVLDQAVAGLTVREMILHNHAVEFPVYRTLFELIQERVIVVAPQLAAGDSPGKDLQLSDLVEAAARYADAGDQDRALMLARIAADREPEQSQARILLSLLESRLREQLYGELLAERHVPRLLLTAAELEKRRLTPEERYLVSRIDGKWDLVSLIRVSPMRDLDALLVLKRMLSQNVIAI